MLSNIWNKERGESDGLLMLRQRKLEIYTNEKVKCREVNTMKKIMSLILVMSILMTSMGTVFAVEDVEDNLQLKIEEYLDTFPADSADKLMFIREIEMLKDYDSYNEEEVDKVYKRFKPVDVSSLPEIEPIEIPDDDAVPDESTVIRISEEEREHNEEENRRLLDHYAEMMEGMSDEEAVEMGIDEEIIYLVRLRELQELEKAENEIETIENSSSRPKAAPKRLSLSANTTSKAPMIASGLYHNVYLKGDGTVWTWGNYNMSNIRLTMDTYTVPTKIPELFDIIEVAASDYYALALTSSGTVYAWGMFTGTGIGSRDPVIVSGLNNIIAIDAGTYKSIALKSDGTVYEWTTGTFCAKQVMQSADEPLTGVKAIASGYSHLFALKDDGTVVVWGYDYMQEGKYPFEIQNINNAVDISASSHFVLILTNDGKVYSWEHGYTSAQLLKQGNSGKPISNIVEIYTGSCYGAIKSSDGSLYLIGSGELLYNKNPNKVEDISNVLSFSGGYYHYVIVKNDGSIWTKGYNDEYQLGIGDRYYVKDDIARQIYSFLDVKQVEAGISSVAIIKSDDTVWTFGEIVKQQYGYTAGDDISKPVQVIDMNDQPLTDVSMVKLGKNNGYALKNGMVWSWGSNTNNVLGRETSVPLNKAAPVRTNEDGNPYLTDIISISTYSDHVMALDKYGDIWAWGKNSYGQLGLGNTDDQPYAVKIPEISNIKEISCGYNHSMALDCNGRVWTWGNNSSGQLGLGDRMNRSTPQMISSLNSIKNISGGGYHSLVLGEDGCVWFWGESNKSSSIPIKLSLDNIIEISTGLYHSLALDSDGYVWSWGVTGRYGINNTEPKKVLENTISITAGNEYSLALKNNGSVWGWGGSDSGHPGDGRTVCLDWIPVMNITPKITQVSSKLYHSLVLKSDGTVWASGYNDYGQLGNTEAEDENVTTPIQVMGVDGNGYLDNIIDVKAGEDASLALTRDGKVLAWGYNDRGKLGQPLSSSILSTPTYVKGIDGTGELSNIIAIDTGSRHTLALSSNGKVYAWGDNTYRQLGDGTGTRKVSPTELTGLSDIIAISAYGNHSLALKSDGTVWAWGQNDLGQLGSGETSTYESIPVQVKTGPATFLDNVKKISAGYSHNAVLKSDGTIWTWGHNDCGQLGINNTTPQYYATQVTSISNVNAIFAGARSTYVIMDGDELKAWGQNTDGKLGDKSVTNSLTPISVSSSEKIKTVDGSWNSTAAITTNGKLLMWGTNSNGQFGIGSMENVSKVPVAAYVKGITYNDYGSSFASAVSVIPNKRVRGEIAKNSEEDYFKFTADFTGKHTIDITGDVSVEVYDNSKSMILPLNMAYTLTRGQTYYIKVTSNVTSIYTFIIRSENPDPFFARYSFKSGFINPTEITNLTSGHVEGHLVVANDYIEPRDVLVAMVLYRKDNNAVHGVDIVEKTLPAQTSDTMILGLQVPSDYQNYRIKAIIWDSREDMNQLGEEIIFE